MSDKKGDFIPVSSKGRLLSKLGIKRNALKKDLFFFFIPFLTVFYLELAFCGRYGKGLSGLWTILWGVIKQPQLLFVLPRHRAIGLVLFVFGLSTMIIAQATLFRNYSSFVIIRKDHQLITRGIYRITRNPIYLGAFIVFTGLPVYANSLYGFLTMLLLLPIFLYRIRLEEQLLAEEFQDAYHKYKETTRKLIPFIY